MANSKFPLPKSPLEDPLVAAHAWARYRRLMRLMMMATVFTVILALAVMYRQEGLVSVHFYIAMAIGIAFSMLLISALMGAGVSIQWHRTRPRGHEPAQ